MAALTAANAITIGGVQCWDEGVKERLATGSQTSVMQRTIVCRWTDRVALYGALTGSAQLIGTVIIFRAPAAYPDITGFFVDNIEMEPVPGENGTSVGANGMIAYDYARLTVTYKNPQFVPGVETGTVSVDFASSIQNLENGALVYADDSTPVTPTSKPPLHLAIIDFERSRKSLPAIPLAAILNAAMNPVNSADLTLNLNAGEPPMTLPAGTILFRGARTFGYTSGSGGGTVHQWDMIYRLSFSPLGWNYTLDGQGAKRQIKKKNGDPMYPTSNLLPLLQ